MLGRTTVTLERHFRSFSFAAFVCLISTVPGLVWSIDSGLKLSEQDGGPSEMDFGGEWRGSLTAEGVQLSIRLLLGILDGGALASFESANERGADSDFVSA